MSQRIHRGLWFLRLFLMCASLVGVLLVMEHLKHKRISLEAVTGAHAEEGISARVIRETASEKNKASSSSTSNLIDNKAQDN